MSALPPKADICITLPHVRYDGHYTRQQITRADRSHRERRRICGSGSLKVSGRLLAALRHYIVGEVLTFVKGRHSGAFNCADVHKHVTRAVARSDESKALLGIKKLHSTCRHGDFPCSSAASS